MKTNKITFLLIVSLVGFLSLGNCQMAKGQTKWVGNVMGNYVPSDFSTYWNQVTLQWLGKWAQVQPSQTTWNWATVDASYNYAKTNGFPYKEHTFIWRIEDPSWLSGLTSAARIQAIKTWMQTYCTRYPNTDFIDVVNEPLHEVPAYAADLGGNGTTGWDWVITSFQYARQYCPNAKLLINDYNIVAFDTSTTKYLEIINLLKARNLIDGIGIQCHQLEGAGLIPIIKNLYRLSDTGLPVYVSQLDLFAADDIEQRNLYKKLFPLLYEHPGVKGVTLWGYRTNEFGITTSGLLNGTTERPALDWLKNQYFNSTVNKGPRAFWTSTTSGLTVSFSGAKSWDFDGTISTYEWNFGDGSTGTSQTAPHTYTAAGTYGVSLTVTDNQGLKDTFTDQVVVSSSSSSTVDWTKPIANCREKFIGSTIKFNYLSPNWDRYWNQATPEYLGEWTSTQPNKDQMDWSGLDFAWNYTKSKGYLFKGHTFVWGQQIPYWVAGLSAADQAYQVEEWIKLYCKQYPEYQLIDVVNEPLHETPNYVNAIGGTGSTGWDWVIWAYTKARQYCPNAKLLINEYDVLNNDANLVKYLQIINLLKARNLLDGIGQQAHHFEYTSMTQLQTNLNILAATNLPIYISELDFDLSDNTQHLNRMKQVVPLFYEHPSVKGITFWGYIRGDTWLGGSWLYDQSATSSTGTATCTTQNLRANIPLTLGIWNDYTVSIPTPGKIRAVFANDGAANSQTMAVDYAIIDGVKYEAENQPVNTGVWNGASCGGSFSQMLHCPGYIEFPSGSSSVIIRAKAVDKGNQQLTIQLVTGCTGGSTTVGLPQERASLKWLKYEYLPTITSTTKPNASFKFTITGNTVSFDAGLSTDCDGTIIMYSWAFGDTTTGSGVKVDHPYTSGTYNIQLTVFDNSGNGDVMTQTVTIGTVTSVPPKALFTAAVTGLKVDVTATGSVDTDGTIASYSWSWNDSQPAGSGFTSTHTYGVAGTYNVTLTVTDDKGATGKYSQNVVVSTTPVNTPPTASFTWSANQLIVTFNAASSKDTEGSIASYSWNFMDGGSGTGVAPTYTYKAAGTYNVILTVTDSAGLQATSTQQVNVQAPTVNQPPVCTIGSCNVWYLQVNCNSASTDDAGIANYLWEWADGLTDTGASLQAIQHNYATPNTYNIKLTVRDAAGLSSSCTKTVVTTSQATKNNPPVSRFGYWADSLNLNFWFEGWDSDGSVVSYLWDFGTGKTSTSNAPTYTFPAAGKYTVTLTVTDNGGAKGVSSQIVNVVNTPKNFHIQTFTKSVIKSGALYYGRMVVKIFDNTGKPVPNVLVSGQISSPAVNLWENVSGTTGSNGIATITSVTGKSSLASVNACAWSFQYSGTLNLWYNAADNKVTSNCI